MSAMASQITGVSIVGSGATVGSGENQRKYRISASLAFVCGIPLTGEFIAKKASNAENVSIWWCHHGGMEYIQNVREYRIFEIILKLLHAV